MDVVINVKDLPEVGLTLIPPADASFPELLRSLERDIPAQREQLRLLAPYSVFIRHTGTQDIVAYRLKWEFLRPNGKVTTSVGSYLSAIGDPLPAGNLPSNLKRTVIRPGAAWFYSSMTSPVLLGPRDDEE